MNIRVFKSENKSIQYKVIISDFFLSTTPQYSSSSLGIGFISFFPERIGPDILKKLFPVYSTLVNAK